MSEEAIRARPKSMILTWPLGKIWMLPGLRSRWTISFSWAKLSPSHTCSIMRSFSSRVSDFRWRIISRRSVPSSSSIAMNILPLSSPKS